LDATRHIQGDGDDVDRPYLGLSSYRFGFGSCANDYVQLRLHGHARRGGNSSWMVRKVEHSCMATNMVHANRGTHHLDHWIPDGAWSVVRILKMC